VKLMLKYQQKDIKILPFTYNTNHFWKTLNFTSS